MPRVCTACRSPYLRAINDALAAGKSLAEVARFARLSEDTIGRHRKHAQLTTAPVTTTDSSAQVTRAEQIQVWLRRAEELYFRAGAANDLRGQVASLREGLRALELDLKRAGELSTANTLQSQVNITQSLTLADFDRIIERVQQDEGQPECLPSR